MKYFPVRKYFQVKKLHVKKHHVKFLQVRKNLHVKKLQVRKFFHVKFFQVRKYFQVKKLQVKKRHVKLFHVRKNLHVKKLQVRKFFHVKYFQVKLRTQPYPRQDGRPSKPPWHAISDLRQQRGPCRQCWCREHGIRAQRQGPSREGRRWSCGQCARSCRTSPRERRLQNRSNPYLPCRSRSGHMPRAVRA